MGRGKPICIWHSLKQNELGFQLLEYVIIYFDIGLVCESGSVISIWMCNGHVQNTPEQVASAKLVS